MKALFEKFLNKMNGHLSILPDKSEENAHNTLSALWHTAAGNRVSVISAQKLELPFLVSAQIVMLENMVNSRLAGVPLAHLTERQNFMGLDYILNVGHYIPRNETELLANTAIEVLLTDYSANLSVKVIDVCTGIGTVALAIAHYCKNTLVSGTDIYEPAIEAAKVNARHFGLNERSTFYLASMFDPYQALNAESKADIIVSAPPYISTGKVKQMAQEISDHEPKEAFDAGPFGLSIFNKLITESPDHLNKNGYLIFECGAGQGEYLAKRIRSNPAYGEVTELSDDNGIVRVLKAKIAG